ncbi:hypothetical protein [Cysteiniphilum sp. JM-1]|uniref:hypothetical protein n=1 Tax=Cysteiniphilum sp. JM-1 TaxID=2610891 RepID=UPI00124481E2|nr:hypothetical protein [Cysteiniphilum sp. JM-1]
MYSIEIGESKKPSKCFCCDHDSYTSHGFVYKNNKAYAVYYAAWSYSHIQKKITLAIAIGDWDDNSSSTDRICFGVEITDDNKNMNFHVIDPEESPWANTELLGKMIERKRALHSKFLTEIFTILEDVIHEDKAIKEYMEI